MSAPVDAKGVNARGTDEIGPAGLVWPAFPALCLCVMSAVTACAAAGLLALPFAAALVGIAAGTWATTNQRRSPTSGLVRSVVTGALVTLPWPLALLTTDALASLQAGAMPAEGLAVVAGGLLGAQLLRTDGPRTAVLTLALAVTCVMLAGTRSTAALPVLAMAVCLVTALTTLSLLQRTHLMASAAVVALPAGGSTPRSAGLLRVGRMVALATLVAVVTALVVPLDDAGRARGFARGPGETQAQSRSADAYVSGLLDMNARGRLPDYPVVRVPADSPTLWRGTTLTTYQGGQWFSPAGATASAGPDNDRPERSDRVEDVGGFQGVLLSPGRPTGLGAGVRSFTVDGATIVQDPLQRKAASAYTVRSRSAVANEASLRAVPTLASADDQQLVESLQLPANLPQRVRDLGRELVGPAANRFEAVRAVEDHLHATATYQLDSPVPGPGVDPVDDFLFTSHQGFCEHFAAAAVVLLRAGGVPARMVTGFAAGGRPDASGGRIVHADEAHAWIEVWYPGVGWSESDPTASSRLSDGRASLTDALRALLAQRSHRVALAVALLLLAGAVVAGVAVRRRRRSRDTGGAGQSSRDRAHESTLALERLDVALERAGVPRRASETLSELRIRLEQWPAVPLSASESWALICLERERYGSRRPALSDRRRAVEQIDGLTARVLASARADAAAGV